MNLTTDILYDALERLEGAVFAGIIGPDGLSIDMAMFDEDLADLPHDAYEADIELAALASAASLSAERLNVGNLNDMIIQTDALTYLLSSIMPGYYAVMGVDPNSSLGRARFAMRDMVGRILDEL